MFLLANFDQRNLMVTTGLGTYVSICRPSADGFGVPPGVCQGLPMYHSVGRTRISETPIKLNQFSSIFN